MSRPLATLNPPVAATSIANVVMIMFSQERRQLYTTDTVDKSDPPPAASSKASVATCYN